MYEHERAINNMESEVIQEHPEWADLTKQKLWAKAFQSNLVRSQAYDAARKYYREQGRWFR